MDLAGKQIGNYVAKSELGSGGMGVVYLCEHPLIRRRVAAKVLHEELAASEEIVRRLYAEAKAANEIHSEHIIEVLDFGRITDQGRDLVYLLMEFLEGEALGTRLWRTGLTIDESLHIVSQCCEALEASHKVGIVHRDLKPENVFLLDRRGDPNFVKILDFGIAKVSGNPSTKTRTGVLLGTPAYMSPEQCRGSGSVDARADVYSLGIVLYELTTGDVPFNAEGYGQVLLAQMTEKPKPPTQVNKDLPKVVEAVIMRALEKDPAQRFQTMAEFGKAIEHAEQLLQSHRPIEQIPRKGLHQRETFVANARSRKGSVTNALAAVIPTPVDASISTRMVEAALDAPTQLMDAIDPVLMGLDLDKGRTLPGSDRSPTVVDREVPKHVTDANLGQARTELAEKPHILASYPNQGPTQRVEPQPAPVAAPASPLLSSIPTVVRPVVEPLPSPTNPHVDEAAIFPKTGRYLLIGALVLTLVVIAVALALR